MDKLKQKREERAEKIELYEALVEAAGSRELTKEENDQETTLDTEIKALNKEIEQLERIETNRKANAKLKSEKDAVGAPQDDAAELKEMNKISRNYKFSRVIQNIFHKKDVGAVDGLELEMFQEAAKEAKECGIALEGNIAIPSRFMQIGAKKRLLDVATEGTDAVFTEYGGLIPILRPDPICASLGVTFMTGLRGNVQFPRQNGDVAYAFETEASDVNETTPTLNNISLSPKRFGGYVDVTQQFLNQSVFVVEPWIRAQLEARYALTLDTQGLVGTGASNSCTGVINYSGVNTVSLGSGSANDMTWGALLEFIRATKVANARRGRSGWLTNANGEFALARTPMQSGGLEGNFMYKMDGKLAARPFNTSELIPSDYSEGGQTDLVGMIYSSRWESLIIGTWGGLDLLFDPYTQALGGKKRFVVNAFMDVEVEQPLEFAVSTDWDATDLPAITA
jgi:hypothetical protein